MLDSNERPPIQEIPGEDLVHAVVGTIVGLVPVSRWTFARFKADAGDDQFLSSDDESAEVRAAGFRSASKEYGRQIQRQPCGPAIGATRSSDVHGSGLSLLFADNRARFGILTLFRDADLGQFTSADVRTLTFALDAACDRFSESRLMESELGTLSDEPHERRAVDDIAYYIVNKDLQIVLSWTTENQQRVASAPHVSGDRLPPVLAEAVRRLTAGWTDDPATQQPGTAYPVPFLKLRTRPMTGATGSFISVSIERFQPMQSLIHAAAHYRMSPRELQVLSLLVRGTSLHDIARELAIASSTVQDHIKRLIEKTRAGNRSEMIANVFRHNTVA